MSKVNDFYINLLFSAIIYFFILKLNLYSTNLVIQYTILPEYANYSYIYNALCPNLKLNPTIFSIIGFLRHLLNLKQL